MDWEKLGISCVVPFENPLEALERAGQETVDIVLSDIRMPHMDGIELCRNILKINPSASIIFISGYSDKEYLLSAIQMSAVDYVEKPVNVPQLESVLERAVLRIRQLRSMQKDQQAALEIVQKNRQMYIDQLVAKLIHGQLSFTDSVPESPALQTLLEKFPLNSSDFYRVYLWRCRKNTTNFDAAIQSAFALLKNQKDMPGFLISRKDEQNCLFLLRFSSQLSCDTSKIGMLFMQGIRQVHGEHSISCSYGDLLQGAENIRTSYNQSVIAMQQNFYSGYGALLSCQDSPSVPDTENAPSPTAPLSALTEGIRSHSRSACEECLKEFYRSCKARTDILSDIIKNEYFKLLSVFAPENPPVSAPQGPDTAIRFLWKQLNGLETLEECHNFCLSEIAQYFDRLESMASDKKIILEVMQYVQKHYHNHDLYIDTIAKQVHMSPNYLSSLFKKETGKTIGNYITEVRLEQSCRLLSSDKKLLDIALAVGYTDMNYYSKLFKKYYHVTPSEYRNCANIK